MHHEVYHVSLVWLQKIQQGKEFQDSQLLKPPVEMTFMQIQLRENLTNFYMSDGLLKVKAWFSLHCK